jgi:phosphoribosylformylglycinamidine synthase
LKTIWPESAGNTTDGNAPSKPESEMKARVHVMLKDGVLDPQGEAIRHALGSMGFSGVNGVRQGKVIELDLADGATQADVVKMCEDLLANTVIESYRIEMS